MLRAAHEGRLVVVPGATHLVSLARPDDFSAVVLGVVAELEARAARDTPPPARGRRPDSAPCGAPRHPLRRQPVIGRASIDEGIRGR